MSAMKSSVHRFSPALNLFQNPAVFLTSIHNRRTTLSISCTSKKPSDADLSLDLSMELAKLKSQSLQKHKAMKKSRQILFSEICKFASFKEDEMKINWMEMEDEERRCLVKEFLSYWGSGFHPLSARAVKEMVDAYLVEDQEQKNENKINFDASIGSSFFPVLKKLMGLTQQT